MAQKTSSKTTSKRKKKRRRKQSRTGAVLVLILLLIIAGLFLLFLLSLRSCVRQAQPAPVPSPEPTLARSELDPDCFGFDGGYLTYESDSLKASLGLDISSHQGWIDWQAVADSDIDFVILRAGYRGYGNGSIHQDEYLDYNLAAAKEAGLKVGLYFFSQALSPEEAAAEAHTVLSMIGDYKIDLPIYFDWELIDSEDARTSTISASELTACAQRFCQVIEDAGYRAGVYFNLEMAQHYYNLLALRDYEFWLAEYQNRPSFPYAVGMWQYSADGTAPGIETTVDLNLCFIPDEG